MVTFSTEPISDSTHTYSNSPMTLVDNAENLASPGLAEPYAASPSPTRSLLNLTWNSVTEMGTAENAAAAVLTESEMSEEGETSSVVHHLQRDSENHSVNTECDLLVGMTMSPSRTNCSDDEGLLFRMPNLLVNTAGGIMSPPRLNFFSEEAPFLTPNFHADMVGGMMMSTSPPRMNYFSPPSGDSIGNSDPYRLWNFADHSEAQELENRKGMTMRPTCIKEVDAVLGQKNQSLGIWAAENMGGTVQQSCWGTHPHPQPQTSDDDSVNNVDEWFQLAGGMMATSPTMMNYSLRDAGEYSVIGEFRYMKRVVKVTVSWNDSELLFHNESLFEYCWNIDVQAMEKGLLVAHTDDVHLFWKFKCIAFNLIEFEVGMEFKPVTRPPSGECDVFNVNAVVEFLEKDFVLTILLQLLLAGRRIGKRVAVMDNIARASADFNMIVNLRELCICILKAELRIMQLDRPCEGHIPESSATNEERNNVAELNNSIDAKGGNSSSDKTDTISRWEKDHGITRQVLERLFGKSRDAAAKTLKVSTSTLKRACRDFGINRWPNHKGKMPNCSLNQKQYVQAVKKHKGIQPSPALPPLQATNTSQCNSTIMSVKVTYKNDTIRFPLSSSSTIKYLEEQLETKFKISLENFSIKYQDEEDEWITLTCDSELLHGLDVLRSCGKTVIRMMITPKFD